MVKVIFNQQTIKQMVGLDSRKCLLYPHMDLDSRGFSSPIMVEDDGGERYLFVKDIERGNFDERDLAAKVKFYRTYMTFDPVPDKMPDEWMDLLDTIVSGDQLATDDGVFYSAYEALAQKFKVVVSESIPWWRVYKYEIKRADVIEEFKSSYAKAVEDAKKIAPKLAERMAYKDSRFERLDAILEGLKLNTLIVSSPLNSQETTGIPFDFFENESALVVYNHDHIWALTNQPIMKKFCQLTGVFADLKQAIGSLPISLDEAVGIEENHLTMGLFKELGLNKVCPLGVPLRQWRESRTGEELPFYVIAAHTTRYGMETALRIAQENIQQGIDFLETDVEQYLYTAYENYVGSQPMSITIQPYFLVLHNGRRTGRPNLPQFAPPVNGETRSLKIDSGIKVIDQNGLIRAVSDLCRTLPLDAAAKELYGYLDKLMTQVSIPAAVPGRTGEEVFLAGTRDFAATGTHWVELGILPQGCELAKEYTRDIGHVLGKQEPATLGFRKGNQFVLQEGMVACVEYQWPYFPYAIGVEDMLLVSSEGAINITR